MANWSTGRTVEERFWNKVDLSNPDGCWEWTAFRDRDGYGRFSGGARRADGKPGTVGAHRWSWEFFHGPIPDGLVSDHKCHNRGCVNPEHIQLVTPAANCQNRRGADRDTISGVRGVCWVESCQRWRPQAVADGKVHYGRYYTDLADAEAAAIALRLRVQTNNLVDRGENITNGELVAV